MSKKGIAAIKRKTGYSFDKCEQVAWQGLKKPCAPVMSSDIWILSGPVVYKYALEQMTRNSMSVTAMIEESGSGGEWCLDVTHSFWDEGEKRWAKRSIGVMRGKYNL